MNTISNDRNGTAIFAERTQKNLEFIVASAAADQDVHPVTEVVSSLLGILVFPWEHSALDRMKNQKLPVLVEQHGWPRWVTSGTRKVANVGQLVHVVRNCVAHGSVEFDSDSRSPAEVRITFTHVQPGSKAADWQGQIRADELVTFCRCFTAGMKGFVD